MAATISDHVKDFQQNKSITSLFKAIYLIFKEGNPAGVKAVFEQLKLANDTVRLPLVSASSQLKLEITHAMSLFAAI